MEVLEGVVVSYERETPVLNQPPTSYRLSDSPYEIRRRGVMGNLALDKAVDEKLVDAQLLPAPPIQSAPPSANELVTELRARGHQRPCWEAQRSGARGGFNRGRVGLQYKIWAVQQGTAERRLGPPVLEVFTVE